MQANSVDLERLMKEVVDIEFRDTFRVAGEEIYKTESRIFLLTTIKPRSFGNFCLSLSTWTPIIFSICERNIFLSINERGKYEVHDRRDFVKYFYFDIWSLQVSSRKNAKSEYAS